MPVENSDVLLVQAAPQDSGFTSSRSSLLLKEHSDLEPRGISLKFLWKGEPLLQPEEQGAGTWRVSGEQPCVLELAGGLKPYLKIIT